MPRELETPRDVGDIYLARADEVEVYRPIVTGDVFSGVHIPGVDDTEKNLAMVVTHPCSMRGANGRLNDKVTFARVSEFDPFPLRAWPKLHQKKMPLPELLAPGDAAFFLTELEEAGRVRTSDVAYDRRIACLSDFGIMLMLQRLVFSHTREIVDINTLTQVVEHVLEEVRLLEEWNQEIIPNTQGDADINVRLREEGAAFDALLSQSRTDEGGNDYTLRGDLLQQPRRAGVRRTVREAIRMRIIDSQVASGGDLSASFPRET